MQHWITTRYFATRLLAYCHQTSPAWLPKSGFTIAARRELATWLGLPCPEQPHDPLDPQLGTCLVLLHAANLLTIENGRWQCQPHVFTWLQQPRTLQLTHLYTSLYQTGQFNQTATALGLKFDLPNHLLAYWRQQARRQLGTPLTDPEPAKWGKPWPDGWEIWLPARLRPDLLFHLHQLGTFSPPSRLHCTPLTIAHARNQGYSTLQIQSLLTQATGQPLSPLQMAQLTSWAKRHHTYQLRPVYLLSTKQPEQLAAIAGRQRLRQHFHEQLSPRHVLVSPELASPLRRWLEKQGYPLHAPDPGETHSNSSSPAAYSYLGLQLLAGLGEFSDPPVTLPADLLAACEQQLTPTQQAQVQTQAQAILSGIRAAIAGQDAFFPPTDSTPSPWLETIQAALAAETPLSICYQSLAAAQPGWRQIQPLRLEQRGTLHYLHAWCYRAEANLTFRLDRIQQLQPAPLTPPPQPPVFAPDHAP